MLNKLEMSYRELFSYEKGVRLYKQSNIHGLVLQSILVHESLLV